MRGLDYIAKMRRKGFKPASITLNPTKYDEELLPNWVQYEPNDTPETHDLRAVIGLFVTVMGSDSEIVQRWVGACLIAGAGSVISFVYDDPNKLAGRWQDHRLYGIDQ